MNLDLTFPNSGLAFLAYVALFIGILLAFEGLRNWMSRDENVTEARNRRMRMVKGGASTEEVLNLLRSPDGSGGPAGPISRLRRLLTQSGARIGLGMFALLCVTLGAGVFLLALQYIPPELAAPVAVVFGVVLPLLVLSGMKSDRDKKLTKQLPEALDLMARGLRVGHPLAATVGSVAEDMPDPIGTEFGIIQDQVAYGDEIVVAFREFAERVGTEDAHYLAVSVGIQHGTGGNLARVLEILSKVIRDRQTMQKKIRAISSEGRLSALILTVLPVAIFLSIHLKTPSFYGDVMDDPAFKPFAIAIVTLVVVQGLILRKLVNFKF